MISARNLVKRFGTETVVDDVSFEVKAGETFAFLGPNGAGKSTTIKMLTTLLPPSSGCILIDGIDVARQPMVARSRFGIVFQDCTLDQEMTVRENLWMHCAFYGVPARRRKARIDAMMDVFGLGAKAAFMVGRLSGGLKRRVEIARALLHEPPLIFLDEPTLGLDPQSRRQLWLQLQNLQQNFKVTLFLTTHYLDEVERFASQLAVIDHGKIIAQGKVAEVTAQQKCASLEDAFLALTGGQAGRAHGRRVLQGVED